MPFNRKELYLIKLMEECAEVTQRASKALIFGLEEIQEGQNLNNLERIQEEFLDIVMVMQLLREEDIDICPGLILDFYDYGLSKANEELEQKILERMKKVEKYTTLSARLGKLVEMFPKEVNNQGNERVPEM